MIVSACSKTIPVTEPRPQRPTPVIITIGDQVSWSRLQFIIKRTNYFCNLKKRGNASKITINHNAEASSTRVSYKCQKDT